MQPKTAAAENAAGACQGFDPDELEKCDWRAWIANWLFSYPVHRFWMGIARYFTPVFRMPFAGLWIVLRYDAVREVLNQDGSFPVSWGWKMVEVTGGDPHGRNFVLGMGRTHEGYQLSYDQLAEAFPLADVQKHVVPKAANAAETILEAVARQKKVEFDAIEELITAVPTELCESYYGITIADRVAFAKWTLAISSYLFGPPLAKRKPGEAMPADGKLANAAAACLRATIRDAIAIAEQDLQAGRKPRGVVLGRFLEMQAKDPRVTDDVIHAQLFGMVMGFIPTNVLAGGNVLETLLTQGEFMKHARAAAIAGDDDLLWRCLREALRFRNINPGPLRLSAGEYVLERGGYDEARIPANAAVIASTQAAMFDPRRVRHPNVFDPNRPDEDYMMFSVGQHWCLGAYIAIAQLTQTFKALLRREGLARLDGGRGGMKRFKVFPLHLYARFRP